MKNSDVSVSFAGAAMSIIKPSLVKPLLRYTKVSISASLGSLVLVPILVFTCLEMLFPLILFAYADPCCVVNPVGPSFASEFFARAESSAAG